MKDIYLKIDGPSISGESADEKHLDWIEVISFSHYMRQPRSVVSSSAGGHTSERVEHGEIILRKEMDSVSPQLYLNCSSGQTFDKAELHFMRADADGARVQYMTIELLKVLISSVSPSVESEGLPTESVSLKYAAAKWTYRRQGIGGLEKGSVQTSWSLNKNTATFSAG